MTKRIDDSAGFKVACACRHDGGRPRDRMSIEVLMRSESFDEDARSVF